MSSQDRSQELNTETLREEFDRLTREQDEAMRLAVYFGMRANEAKEYDERRKRLTELFKRLYVFKS